MQYKNTLNLPRTDFPMRANLVAREPERLKKWEEADLYHRIQQKNANGERFMLHDGPPFANGDVHIGTALNKILKDFIVKYQGRRARNAPYIPGWDCHGLPIEFKVAQELRKQGVEDPDAGTLRKACEQYAFKYIDVQREQFKRLGVFGEWEKPYLTLDARYEAEELRLFADIVEQGFVFRGRKPVYWSIPCRTALAEAEVEYKEHVSQSIYVKFPIVGQPNTSILIWTTTPWTLPANLAVAYNSTFQYTQVQVGDESYILSNLLLDKVAEECGWSDHLIMRHLDGQQLSSLEYQHPFCNRKGKLFAGDAFVDNTTGTGFVHVAPGHGLDDYMLGREQGLPIYSPVDDNGCFAYSNDLPREEQLPETLIGKSILEKNGTSEANEGVLQILRDNAALVHQEDYSHSYPHCWRSKTPVIFRAMDQWFINIDHQDFRQQALKAIDNVKWVPEWGKHRMAGAVQSRPDWCISRQRTWGVPIPAFYNADGEAILDARVIRGTADLIEQHGSNVWFEKECRELWDLVRPNNWTGSVPVSQATDTLDVWIDSGSSSRAFLMREKEWDPSPAPSQDQAPIKDDASWRADIYLEGSDQHRGWFQSSLMLSLAGNGHPPYKTVLTHGFMVDADREKISKSRSDQYELPRTSEAYVGKYGADILRLWVSSQDFRNDIVVSEDRINKVAETYRVIRNALRFELSNLYDFEPADQTVHADHLTLLDRWILDELRRLEDEVTAAYERCEFHVVYQRISQFASVELSAIYHDLVKDRLYTEPAESESRRSTQATLHRLVTSLCELLSPILTFTADEAWEFIPDPQKESSVHLSWWQPKGLSLTETEKDQCDRLFGIREQVLPELEAARQSKTIGKALEAKVVLRGKPEVLELAQRKQATLKEMLNVSQLVIEEPADPAEEGLEIAVAHADGAKCERCWHWENDVGHDQQHPTLCGKCVGAVSEQLQQSPG